MNDAAATWLRSAYQTSDYFHGTHPIRAFQTKTFAVVIDANMENLWIELCDAIGKPELSRDERFNSRKNRNKNKEALYAILEQAFLEKTGEEWLDILEIGRAHV